MLRKSKLNEGMWAGDLEDLVLPVVSIDEYESKVDVTATVIGFYVRDRDAADDLNRFIQKSPVSLIDTDISPAPDQRGYYMVFVELLTNDSTVKMIDAILEEVKPLTNIDAWKMRMRGKGKLVEYDADAIKAHLEKSEAENRMAAVVDDIKALADTADRARKLVRPERVMEFFHRSNISGFGLRESILTINDGTNDFRFDVLGLADCDRLLESLALTNEPISMDFSSIKLCEGVSQMLGGQWVVMRVGDVFLASTDDSNEMIAIQPVE